MPVSSWKDVDEALHTLGLLSRDIAAEELVMNDAIIKTKRLTEAKVAALAARRDALDGELLEFVRSHHKDLGADRSSKLTWGTVGVKDFPPEVAFAKGQKEDAVAELLIKRGYAQCVQVKKKVIKNAVKALNLTEEALARLSLKLRQKKNQPFYVIDEDKIAKEARD
jgi:phage host-nuclease inhibitor protein Gam